MNSRTLLVAAGLLGLTGVALGAFGAHALKDILLERGMSSVWETASRYQLLHAVGLFAIAAWARSSEGAVPKLLRWTGTSWIVGTVLFSGSLYVLALGGPRWMGPITPLGGLALMAGWLGVIAAGFSKKG
jgi:uncharacterized membrane protein YgdD (TMEM256/DUF423 family)